MKKIFKIYNAVSTDVDLEDRIEVSNINEVYDIIHSCWGVEPFQVKIKYNDYSKFYEIAITNKFAESFAWIGDINFNPYE